MSGLESAFCGMRDRDCALMAPRATIFGCAGPRLTAAETAFFREADPWGFILFQRNVESPDQLRGLTQALRAAVGRQVPILIDQEGGRVARMGAPHWTEWDNALPFADALPPDARAQAMRLRYQVIALELAAVGIDVNCAPMADLAGHRTHPDIRQRCYSTDPAEVARLGRAVADGLMAGGVLPVLKHMPGHGRTPLDSHVDLPMVDVALEQLEATDFAPFRVLADLPMGMTAHIVYPALDPDAPVTLSRAGIGYLRDKVGFGGLLMTDDVSMGALRMPLDLRVRMALEAGCDVILHCNGDRGEMEVVAAVAHRLTGASAARADAVLAARGALRPDPTDIPELLDQIRSQQTEFGHA